MLTIPGTPFYPTALAAQYGVAGQPLEVFWRGLELGPRTDKNTLEQTRFVAGLQGVIGGWDYSTRDQLVRAARRDRYVDGRLVARLDAAADPEQRPHQPVRLQRRGGAGRACAPR